LDYAYLLTPFIIGLFSTLHCLGMCGGIMGALTFSLPPEVRQDKKRLWAFVVSYNLGRLFSYTLAGALIGTLGSSLYAVVSPRGSYLILQWLAALLMIGVGLYLAGWFPRFARIEKVGEPLWRIIEPLGRRMLPVRHPGQALLYGALWGWLPCGMVYTALLLTVTSGDTVSGALYMLAFGLGTLPAMTGAGILAQQLMQLARRPRVRQLAGLILILMAVAGTLFPQQLHHLSAVSHKEQQLDCIQ